MSTLFIEKCDGCGTMSKEVEAAGIWYCPNEFCLATGAWWKRIEAKYQNVDGNITNAQFDRMLSDLQKELDDGELQFKALRNSLIKRLVFKQWRDELKKCSGRLSVLHTCKAKLLKHVNR